LLILQHYGIGKNGGIEKEKELIALLFEISKHVRPS
jgi:hypothetical protein